MIGDKDDANKVMSLREAIMRFVVPGMKLHLAGGIGGPSAAICEIIRQFHGATPGFELIQSTITGHALNLVHCNLARKLVFSACVDLSVSARPSKTIQQAHSEDKLVLENWSLLSLQQRLMAGALGVGMISTRSIMGSTMALDNRDSFLEMEDPFNSGKKVGVLRALNPDLSIVHGWLSDEYGNTVLAVPYGDDIWGPLASLEGVLVTVEKIVSSDAARRYSSLVKIPSSIVRAVCLAPMGVHPFALAHPAVEEVSSYEADIEFLHGLHLASSDQRRLDEWIREWVLGCQSHEKYLEKLGRRKIDHLKGSKARDPAQREGRVPAPEKPDERSQQEYSRNEMLLIQAAREIFDSVMKSGHKTMLVGAGSRSIAARLAYQRLTEEGYAIELITGNGQINYSPQPGKNKVQDLAEIRSAMMLSDTITTHGVLVGGRNSRCLSVLGAGQVDKYGNINSSRTSDGSFLVGTGGANDAANANEVIIIIDQSRERFVETLPYITARGDKVSKVISTMGVLYKAPGQNELVLKKCFPDEDGRSLRELIKELDNNCGWPVRVAKDVKVSSRPTTGELRLLRFLLGTTDLK